LTAEFLTATGFPARHGFFTRRGGVSEGAFASLNCSVSSADSPENVARNRGLVAEAMGVDLGQLVGVWQVHGRGVAVVEAPWPAGEGPKADAMVTRCKGVALGVITADCAPVLFADPVAGVVAAAHAGWRGACGGVLEASVDAMVALGAERARMMATVGPCIAQESYEVAADLRDAIMASIEQGKRFFTNGRRAERWQFDLAGYCVARLSAYGVQASALGVDTYADEMRFFSHRRRTLTTGGPIGHQISAVVL
jgi:YfiH family protein